MSSFDILPSHFTNKKIFTIASTSSDSPKDNGVHFVVLLRSDNKSERNSTVDPTETMCSFRSPLGSNTCAT